MDIRDYLYSLRNRGSKLGLERMEALAEALGNPQQSFRSILVGGTSGKGSTAAMISSILGKAGYRVGLFTSPHLSNLTERIVVDGKQITEKELEDVLKIVIKVTENTSSEHPTFFEVMTAAAFCYFKEQKVDFAVLEVGLGGRLDATKIAPHDISVITNISLEHTRILGNTIEKIAYEKAGIIDGTLVTAADDEAVAVFQDKAAKIIRIGKDISLVPLSTGSEGQSFRVKEKGYEAMIPLLGRHQLENAGCAIAVADLLGISEDAIKEGLKKVKWPGRLEVMQKEPLVVLDCAKDASAMKRLKQALEDFKYEKLIMVLGISSDKDIRAMMENAPAADKIFITEHSVMDRAADAETVAGYVKNYEIVKDVKQATEKAIASAGKKDMVLVTGSVFTVAGARELWHRARGSLGRELNEVPNK